MRKLAWRPARQHQSSGTAAGDACSCICASSWTYAAAAFLLLLLAPQHSSAGIADVIATAKNYGLADVAVNNARLIQRLLQYGWNSSATSALQEALKEATVEVGVYGAAAAFTPAAIQQYRITDAPLFSPYCHEPVAASPTEIRMQDVQCMDIGNITAGGGYNYTDPSLPQTSWFTQFLNMSRPVPRMSGVYFDKGAGEIWMDTYSVPVMSPDNRTLLAVATADIRIEQGTTTNDNTARTASTAASAAAGGRQPHWVWVLVPGLMLSWLA